jgi:hypothetical protein
VRTYESFLVLCAELDGDVTELERVAPHNRRAWERIGAGATDPVDWGALGFTIHTIYGVLENYFLRVSKFFENGLPSEGWHKALVEKMGLDIPGLRPALLPSLESRKQVLELLKFRHRIRNLYGEDLDPGKTALIQRTTLDLLSRFPAIHKEFRGKLMAIAEALR